LEPIDEDITTQSEEEEKKKKKEKVFLRDLNILSAHRGAR
jgi:hypothetical protein